MKVIVNSPLMKDKIIHVLDGYKNGDVAFRLLSQQGMSIIFEVTGLDSTAAIDLTKKIIRSQEFGTVINFQVKTEV